MPYQGKELYEFGPVRLDAEKRPRWELPTLIFVVWSRLAPQPAQKATVEERRFRSS